MISPFMRLALMLRRRSITPPRRGGLRRPPPPRPRRLPSRPRLAVGKPRHLERLVVRGLRLVPVVERHLRLFLPSCLDGAGFRLLFLSQRLGGGDQAVEPLPLVGVEFPEGLEAAVERRLLLDLAHEDS